MPLHVTWRTLGVAALVAALAYGCAIQGREMAQLLRDTPGDRQVGGAESGAAQRAVVGTRF